jgi:hypothetical protein
VEVFNRFGVHSSLIIKQNQSWFPKKALLKVLKSRFKERPAGHWVVFKTLISAVDIFTMAYTWSQKGISYILSTCGSMEPSPNMYRSYFQDEFGNVSYKEINRPSIAPLLFDYLPSIDEHNKQQQSRSALETKWPTRCCWFRLLTTLIGMCVVDLHRLYKHSRPEQFGEIDVLQFSDVLCKNLRQRCNRQERRLV